MPSPRLTISQLAAELGLGVATVSNALNGKGRVASATRERVLAHASERGFKPNAVARNLRAGGPGALELHLPHQAKHLSFYMDFAFGLVDVASEAGRDVVLTTADHPRGAAGTGIDGAVFVDCELASERFAELDRANVPLVMADGTPEESSPSTHVIRADYKGVMTQMLDAARVAGAQRPLMIHPDSTFNCAWVEELRLDFIAYGFAGDIPAAALEFPVNAPDASLIEFVSQILKSGTPIGEFIPDMILFGAQRWAGVACAEMGIGHPESAVPWVASIAGDPASELGSPVIAAHDLHARAFGRRCGEALLDFVDGTAKPDPHSDQIWDTTITWPEHWGSDAE
ncbi:MAG: LacI family DNA-binding transcriptional regulator [Galactobacter sp.]|uniref:LacI family DNA-binding transcriptional regulator n=1 Tax=Galactobacter sp. TaxID=2676125 RepID=UPI0025BC0043|nr:LacI family DNA-binding transcriptional regulator [Galactobacter sp.]